MVAALFRHPHSPESEFPLSVSGFHNASRKVITGLSKILDNLEEAINKLCTHYRIESAPDDISNIMYIIYSNAVLMNFVNIETRGKLMTKYFKANPLGV